MSEHPPVEGMNFETALEELETIVQRLEQGEVKLDQAVQAYERGSLLRKQCEKRLCEARARIEQIAVAPDGVPAAQPFEG